MSIFTLAVVPTPPKVSFTPFPVLKIWLKKSKFRTSSITCSIPLHMCPVASYACEQNRRRGVGRWLEEQKGKSQPEERNEKRCHCKLFLWIFVLFVYFNTAIVRLLSLLLLPDPPVPHRGDHDGSKDCDSEKRHCHSNHEARVGEADAEPRLVEDLVHGRQHPQCLLHAEEVLDIVTKPTWRMEHCLVRKTTFYLNLMQTDAIWCRELYISSRTDERQLAGIVVCIQHKGMDQHVL